MNRIQNPQDQEAPDDSFGLCPECHRPGESFNLGYEIYGACHDHKLRWRAGSNRIDTADTAEKFDKLAEVLLRVKYYVPLEPYYLPSATTRRSDNP